MSRALLNIDKVAEKVGFSKAWVYRAIAKGTFPRPKHLGRAARWDSVDIDEWIARLKRAECGPDVRAAVAEIRTSQ